MEEMKERKQKQEDGKELDSRLVGANPGRKEEA